MVSYKLSKWEIELLQEDGDQLVKKLEQDAGLAAENQQSIVPNDDI